MRPRLAITSRTMRRGFWIAVVMVVVTGAVPALGAAAAPPSSGPPTFSTPRELPDQHGTGGTLFGGEPSITVDVAGGATHAYVSSPQGVPAAVGGLGGSCSNGAAFWRSADGGSSFSPGQCVGSGLGGGDDSTTATPNHALYLADLEIAAAAVCKSTNLGQTFTSGSGSGGCTGLVSDQTGPEDDRPWVTGGSQNQVYFTYHDLAFGVPLIERSDDGGRTFQRCGTILQPGSAASDNYTPTGGTLVSDPAIDKAGNLYVQVSEPPKNSSSSTNSSPSNLYMAVDKGGCANGHAFKDSTIYTNPGANLANIFDADAVDGGGTLYVVAAGQIDSQEKGYGVWLFVSHDGGATWTKPIEVNRPSLTANALPAVVGGTHGGQVAIGWYGSSTSPTPNGIKDVWNYYVATSAKSGAPGTFTQTRVTPVPFHYGDICTQGASCGLLPGSPSNRNLLDFTSLGLNPVTGCLIAAIPGDPYNTFAAQQAGKSTSSSSDYVSVQTRGCFPTS